MEWFVLTAPVPATVEVAVTGIPLWPLACLAIAVPLFLAMRALRADRSTRRSCLQPGPRECRRDLRPAKLGELGSVSALE